MCRQRGKGVVSVLPELLGRIDTLRSQRQPQSSEVAGGDRHEGSSLSTMWPDHAHVFMQVLQFLMIY
jgi:hypothetical protein